ncbi:hypothetical protein BDDG_06866 [Blastomyces dermatitidis ATCC 18188]|uniref:Ankyrin repeat protein n=1 Tax=Ajellomyces dermatitidis (strain ATCC 18188 / CBS 674.68) TaxID=653446 RepID=F2TL08_AJEDA|nr:hypothetical protein BDDG_06866 [Blastomyces dermatitidis ATCC 18188]
MATYPWSRSYEIMNKPIRISCLMNMGTHTAPEGSLRPTAGHGEIVLCLLRQCYEGGDDDIDGTVVVEGFQNPLTALDCAAAGGHDLIVKLLQDWAVSQMGQKLTIYGVPLHRLMNHENSM